MRGNDGTLILVNDNIYLMLTLDITQEIMKAPQHPLRPPTTGLPLQI